MSALAALLVGKPLNVLGVAAVFLVGQFVVRFAGLGSGRHPWSLAVVAGFWALYAAWEWLILVRTPEANIRVDLLLIWPALLIVSVWFARRYRPKVRPTDQPSKESAIV